jgi:hypothetical protein
MSKKRVTIPLRDDNGNLVFHALKTMRNMLEGLNFEGDDLAYAKHDLLGLMGIFCGDYKVMIEISQKDMDRFSSIHGVDFPEFVDGEVVDVEDKQVESKQHFQHLAYVEDDQLSFAIRSNKHFPNAEDEGEDPEDKDAMRYHLYQQVEFGQAIIFEGTTFVAAPTKLGWVIIENGEVVEDVKF